MYQTGKDLIPEISKETYQRRYDSFMRWKMLNEVNGLTEDVLLSYFKQHSQTKKPSSLLAYYSMLKATLKVNDNIDISDYLQLNAFLKSEWTGYKPGKHLSFTKQEIDRFICDASDKEWLDVKVACIFGIFGEMNAEDLTKVTVGNIEKDGESLLVRIGDKKPRSFVITGRYYAVVQKYADLRSPKTADNRFFVNYTSKYEKCTTQLIGKNKFSKMAQRIATYLKLPIPNRYTGTSFRRTIMGNPQRYAITSDIVQDPPSTITSVTNTITSQANSTLDTTIPIVKSEPSEPTVEEEFMLFQTNDSVKSEPTDEYICDTNETTDWSSSLQFNCKTEDSSSARPIYKCEQCGHMNTITPQLQYSQSIENSSLFQVAIDPLSLELQNHPLASQSNGILQMDES